jgi:hypothetical protein
MALQRVTIDNAWVQGDPEISCRAEALAKEDQRPGRSAGFARKIEATEIAPDILGLIRITQPADCAAD